MNRAQKEQAVAQLGEMFEASEAVIVTHYSGLTVKEITDLRTKLRELGGSFKVTKNTLTQRALAGTRYEGISELLAGPTGIAVSEDPVAAAKATYEFAKSNDNLVILGGAMGDQVLDVSGVEQLAKLPSLDELRGKIVGLLQAPAGKLARVAQAPASQLARVIQAYSDAGAPGSTGEAEAPAPAESEAEAPADASGEASEEAKPEEEKQEEAPEAAAEEAEKPAEEVAEAPKEEAEAEASEDAGDDAGEGEPKDA